MKKALIIVLCLVAVVCVIAFTPLKDVFSTIMDNAADKISQAMNDAVKKQNEKYKDENGDIIDPSVVYFHKYITYRVEGNNGNGTIWVSIDWDKCIAENYEKFNIDYNNKQQVTELKSYLEKNVWVQPEYDDRPTNLGDEGQLFGVSNGDVVPVVFYGYPENVRTKYTCQVVCLKSKVTVTGLTADASVE